MADILVQLQRCRQGKNLSRAKQLLTYLQQHQLETHPVLGNYLVTTLVTCGSLPDAQQVFDNLPLRNEYAWTSLISAYADSDCLQHALLLYQKMQQDHVQPNGYTFVALLNACSKLLCLDTGWQIHSELICMGLHIDLRVGTCMLDMYAKCGSLLDAQHTFDCLPQRNEYSWSSLILGYVDRGNLPHAFQVFQKMQDDHVQPNSYTFVALFKACARLKDVDRGRALYGEIVQRGLETDVFIGSTVLDLYAKCGLLIEAQQVFDNVPAHEVVLWNALLAGYAEHGLAEEALTCFKNMQLEGVYPDDVTFPSTLKACASMAALQTGQNVHVEITKRGLETGPFIASALVDMYSKCGMLAEARLMFHKLPLQNVVSWTTLIAEYADHGYGEQALSCYEQMESGKVSPVPATFACTLKACGSIGALETGHKLHAEIAKRGLEMDRTVANTLIDTYCKCGSLVEGQYIFKKMPSKDVVSWTAMIQGYGENHDWNMALQCFDEMEERGVQPNAVTFTCVLAACSHASLVDKGQEYFKKMRTKYGIEPKSEHYGCLVDLLARSGHAYEAERFAEAMRCLPPGNALKALLSACKIHGDVELGLKCFQQLVQLHQEDAASYLLMEDIYTSAGMRSDANKIEEIRRHAGANKKPGIVSIEVNKKLHEFVVGDDQSSVVLEMSDTLNSLVKRRGYVPDLETIWTNVQDDEENEHSFYESSDNYSYIACSHWSAVDSGVCTAMAVTAG